MHLHDSFAGRRSRNGNPEDEAIDKRDHASKKGKETSSEEEQETEQPDMLITISETGDMSEFGCLQLEIFGTITPQDIKQRFSSKSNNYHNFFRKKDHYRFLVDELKSHGKSMTDHPLSLENQYAFRKELILNHGDCGPSKSPQPDEWLQYCVIDFTEDNIKSLPPEPACPNVVLLFLQRNNNFTNVPSSFFQHMPCLHFLDLSNTRIQSLPKSLFNLTKLQVLMLRCCVCLDELPSDIGKLGGSMEVLDLWETELNNLPEEMGELTKLRQLEVSFNGPNDGSEDANLPSQWFGHNIFPKLKEMQALGISVHPEDQQWATIAEDIAKLIGMLEKLTYLNFYFPTTEILEKFIDVSLPWKEKRLKKFKFIVGHDVEKVISRVPKVVELEYDKQDKCLRFVNNEQVCEVIKRSLMDVTAFYLDHHLKIQSLSEFGITNFEGLKFLLVKECSELKVIINEEKIPKGVGVFPHLENLEIHYLWKLVKISMIPVPKGSFCVLKCLRVATCPLLEFILSDSMAQCLLNLEEFIIEDCEAVVKIIQEKKNANYKILPQLKIFVLRYLPKLERIGTHRLVISEKRIDHYGCPKLELNPLNDRVRLSCPSHDKSITKTSGAFMKLFRRSVSNEPWNQNQR